MQWGKNKAAWDQAKSPHIYELHCSEPGFRSKHLIYIYVDIDIVNAIKLFVTHIYEPKTQQLLYHQTLIICIVTYICTRAISYIYVAARRCYKILPPWHPSSLRQSQVNQALDKHIQWWDMSICRHGFGKWPNPGSQGKARIAWTIDKDWPLIVKPPVSIHWCALSWCIFL